MKYDSDTILQVNNSIPIVEYASQYLELTQGKGKRSNEYWTPCPFHSNDDTPSMSFNSDKNVYRCLGCDAKGGLINFVQQYHHLSFPQAVEYLINYSNLTTTQREYSEVLEFLHKQSRKNKEKESIIRAYLPEDIMSKYVNQPIEEWLLEGFKQESLDKFSVRYDTSGNRIVFPIKDELGRIIAIKARTRYKNYKDLGINKYIYYQTIGTNDFLYGLYENSQNIETKKECIIVEAEKGVIKLDGWDIDNAVALSTSHITSEQYTLLLSLKCDLVFAFDKDVKKEDIFKEIKKLSIFTNVYYILDKYNLFEEKQSPYDKDFETWNKLYEERYKIG